MLQVEQNTENLGFPFVGLSGRPRCLSIKIGIGRVQPTQRFLRLAENFDRTKQQRIHDFTLTRFATLAMK